MKLENKENKQKEIHMIENSKNPPKETKQLVDTMISRTIPMVRKNNNSWYGVDPAFLQQICDMTSDIYSTDMDEAEAVIMTLIKLGFLSSSENIK